ncbi:MAG: glycosyltransferase family 2 protein [Planctomycetia bacterium]
MSDFQGPTSVPRETCGEEPVTVFVVSWGRPIYLWLCLDALWRQTRSAARVVLLDNAHPSPFVGQVISAFERRGLFAEVVRFPTNSFENIKLAYRERLQGVGPLHVYLESDAVICGRSGCWLADMQRIMTANPGIGMLGSLVDPEDFVQPETAIALAGGHPAAANFLAKLQSPERGFIDAKEWCDTARDFFVTEPPCPISNPPGRLMMLHTATMLEAGLQPDGELAAEFRRRGMRPAVTPRVRHRHLSLLNIFDHQEYGSAERDAFFFPG